MSPLMAVQLETAGEVISEQVLLQWNMVLNMIWSLMSVETESLSQMPTGNRKGTY